jgi:serine/threonine protein kinase
MTKLEGFLWCPHCGAPHALNTLTCPKTGGPLGGGTNLLRGMRPDTVIGDRYKVREKVGEESIAFLYEGVHRTLGRRVLLKIVHSEGLSREDCEAEIREMDREAQIASLFEHPHVALVFDFDRFGRNEAYLARERSRTTLAARLRVAGSLRIEEAGELLAQILSGLDALHDEDVIHRDLGAHNIRLVERTGCPPLVKIAGLGRAIAPKLAFPTDGPSGIHYASPELVRRESVDHRTDLYSCGVLLFEMLTGRRPFEAATPEQVAAAIVYDSAPWAPSLRPGLDGAWNEILQRALSKDPADRFESALAFIDALPTRVRAGRARRFGSSVTEDIPESIRASLKPDATLIGLPPSIVPPPATRQVPTGSKCDPFIGRKIAKKYEMESLLGSGSAGAVYKAIHIDLQRPVAVKVLHEWNRTSEQFVERFKAEALAASKLDHPNITRILDCGEEPDGTLYLVMEFIEGPSLEAVIETEGRLPPERAVALAVQIVGSLASAHERSIIHRDVKPENIMLVRRPDGREMVKVCDFGLAKLFDGTSSRQELTRNGLMLGSPAYMAPELIRGEKADERTDIYAAGVTLFELLTGQLPHEGATLADMFQKKLTQPPTRPSVYVQDLDPLLEDIVIHALEPKRELRHASAHVLHAELAEVLEDLRAPASTTHVITVSVPPQA